jgi:hypothetical protein
MKAPATTPKVSPILALVEAGIASADTGGKSSGLDAVIGAYHRARQASAATDYSSDRPEWDAYEAAENAVIVFPCQTFADVQAKARFFLENEAAYDTIRNCYDSKEEALLPFLRSLIGEAQA